MEFLKRLEALIDNLSSIKKPLGPRIQIQEEDLSDIHSSEAGVFHYDDLPPNGPPVDYAVDGSLRTITTPTFRLFLAVGVAYTKLGILTIPGFRDVKHVALQSDDEEALRRLEDVAIVKYRFANGEKFFKSDVPEDVVGKVVREAVEIALIKEAKGTALIDGPLYYGIRGFPEIDWWRVEALWDKRVVAVVKRLETSKKLCRAKEWVEEMGIRIDAACNDMAVVAELGRMHMRSYRDVVVFGPFKQTFRQSKLHPLPERYLWYIYSASSIFRVEAFRKEYAEEVLPTLLRNRVVPGLPYHIALVDKLAKDLSKRLARLICVKLMGKGLNLTYDSLMECYAR
ncbi:conserved hypothetical protein [Pyrobaculum aerophilum str. IM2]|uniref:NurA domain-containing protein n=2 Tax=Pyrobaculum aerophilum TaxID=13773 RepID=Q8ZZI4_PYRAE|nr:DNA double-strand break repair nuclease NurA [Pyrobaculum aerophilum]AAL62655.1 conserved hypothetical protein [Pyrobaculum aerophilum str. IM2]HII46709.1 DNA double-strand break repair nuclease NurA [Pyrobaculum aerophilum]